MKKADERFEVRPSTIARGGRGVFARVSVAKGERLLVTGFLVRRGSLADQCTHYADPYKFRIGKDLLIPTGHGGMINHSMRANLERIVTGKKIFLKALRDIAVGEELFHHYGRNALRRFRKRTQGGIR
jgi:SET domain-containing protein